MRYERFFVVHVCIQSQPSTVDIYIQIGFFRNLFCFVYHIFSFVSFQLSFLLVVAVVRNRNEDRTIHLWLRLWISNIQIQMWALLNCQKRKDIVLLALCGGCIISTGKEENIAANWAVDCGAYVIKPKPEQKKIQQQKWQCHWWGTGGESFIQNFNSMHVVQTFVTSEHARMQFKHLLKRFGIINSNRSSPIYLFSVLSNTMINHISY